MPNRGVLVFVGTILIVSGAYISFSTLTVSSSATASGGSVAVYQVLQRNLTVSGNAAAMLCSTEYFLDCPKSTNQSLANVELISYGGVRYYATNRASSGYVFGETVNRTFWFTNSTVYCISPYLLSHITCPDTRYQKTTIILPNQSTSTKPLNGLRLELNVSAQSDGTINVTIDEHNTLTSMNNVAAKDLWPITPRQLGFLCGAGDVPIGYAIFSGYYHLNDFASGTPLNINAPTLTPYCPGMTTTPYYDFKPSSDVATINVHIFGFVDNDTTALVSGAFAGTWTEEFGYPWYPGPSPKFTPFAAGAYTVVAVDEWGQAAILYFVVENG